MAFTQPCFIRMNTKELREYLMNIGYNTVNNDKIDSLGEGLLAVNGDPKMIDSYPNYSSWDNDFFDKYFSNRGDIIDCGTNEELFKAIAAIRDDSDDKQLFTDGKGYWQTCVGKFRFKNESFFKLHKATVQELIEHFK